MSERNDLLSVRNGEIRCVDSCAVFGGLAYGEVWV